MKIELSTRDVRMLQEISSKAESMLADAGLGEAFKVSPVVSKTLDQTKGDPVTLATILLTAAGAGGALSVAMGREGFLTRLAKVLETWVRREVDVKIETKGKKIHISGSASHIERLLRRNLS